MDFKKISMDQQQKTHMKQTINPKHTWLGKLRPIELERIKQQIGTFAINEELIIFLETTIASKDGIEEKLLILYYAKKILPFIERKPDPEHFFTFEDDYRKDRERFDPIRWVDAEIDFWVNIKGINNQENNSKAIIDAKTELSKQWLTRDEIMIMLNLSRTTLNRRIAEGMPCHPRGKSNFFNLEEVSEWLKEDEAA
jgi:hypothetical protein